MNMATQSPDPQLILLILRLAEWAGLPSGINQSLQLTDRKMVRVVIKLPSGDIGWDIPRQAVEGYWPEMAGEITLPSSKKQRDFIRQLFHSKMVLRRELHLFTEDVTNDRSNTLPPS